MSDKNVSRREFIKRNSLAGAGLALGLGMTPSAGRAWSIGRSDPAVMGGAPVRETGWPSWPLWKPEEDEQMLLDVMRSGVWSRSDKIEEFERTWARTVGAERCVTTVNGTNALICAMANLDVGIGDEVILTPYTFIACPLAILQNGAMPIFADVDPETFQIDPEKIEQQITSRTKAIMPVHIGGVPCDMKRIMEIAERHNLVVVEDACQAWLSEFDGRQVGTHGHAGCYSFQNSKNIPLGEGGAIVSDDHDFMDRCFTYHDVARPHGSIPQSDPVPGAVRLATNLRLAEFNAAIGLAMLGRFQEQTDHREANAMYVKSQLESIPGIEPFRLYEEVTRLSLHLFMFRYHEEEFAGMSKASFARAMSAEGIPVSTGYRQLNRMDYLEHAFGTRLLQHVYPDEMLDIDAYQERTYCPVNERLCDKEAMWFSQRLLLGERSDMDQIVEAIEKVRRNADSIRREIEQS